MDTKKIHFKDIFREPADGASIINIEKSLQAYNIIHDQEKLTLDQLHKEIIDRNLDNDLKIYFSKFSFEMIDPATNTIDQLSFRFRFNTQISKNIHHQGKPT